MVEYGLVGSRFDVFFFWAISHRSIQIRSRVSGKVGDTPSDRTLRSDNPTRVGISIATPLQLFRVRNFPMPPRRILDVDRVRTMAAYGCDWEEGGTKECCGAGRDEIGERAYPLAWDRWTYCIARDSRHVSRAEDTYGMTIRHHRQTHSSHCDEQSLSTPIRVVFAYSRDL